MTQASAARASPLLESPSQPRKRGSGYLPSLDGWRAVAIVGVLITHDVPWHLGPLSTASWKDWGGDGVYLFFAISGLLICWRVLEEESIIGSFHLKSFYIRRLFRIQPAALLYLAVILLLKLAGWITYGWQYWFSALFLYQNFLFHAFDPHSQGMGLFTGHFWTLAVEEHFYILLSLLLFTVRRHRILVLGILLCLIELAQAVGHARGLWSIDVSGRRTYWVIQYLLTPAWLALVVRQPAVRALCVRWLSPWIAFLLSLLLVLARESRHAGHLILQPFNSHLLSQEHMLYYLSALWIVATMLHPASWTTRFLELKPLRLVGRLSYSIYLWHVLFFFAATDQVRSPLLRVLGQRPLAYVLTAIFACASYYLVEKPCMRFGHRLAPPATVGRLDMAGTPVEPADATAAAAAR